jgi:hypothetical protein
MSFNAVPRPGIGWLMCGVMFLLTLPLAAATTPWDSSRRWFLLALMTCTIGGVTLWVGWSRLQKAKAARPDLTWWQFVRDDVIVLGIVVVLMVGFMALSHDQREGLMRSLRDMVETISMARVPR